MRRKFKAMQRDIDGRAVDWRTLYLESKEAEAVGGRRKRQKKKGAERDKKADKREKEKQKRCVTFFMRASGLLAGWLVAEFFGGCVSEIRRKKLSRKN